MIEIDLKATQVQAELQALQRRIAHPAKLMQAIATELESQTQQSFADQRQYGGTEKWEKLATVTQKLRAKRGHADSPILNISGGRGLLGSVMSSSTSTTATIGAGSGKSGKYAAMHQFGGKTSSRSMIPNKTIPARPYLPMRTNGSDAELTPKSSESILSLMRDMVNGKLGD